MPPVACYLDLFLLSFLKALANEDTLLRPHCCRHKCFPVCPRRNICGGHKFCVRDTKNVSDFVHEHFVSATNVSQFAQPKKHHGQQCVRINVSSFTRAFKRSFKRQEHATFEALCWLFCAMVESRNNGRLT